MMHSIYGALCADPSAAAALLNGGGDPSGLGKDTTLTKIFVGGLPYHTSDKTLREYFEQFGELEEAVVITDRQTGKSRGYGFVTMKDRISAERACKDPNPIIDGRKANVNLAYLGAKPRGNLQLDQMISGLPLNLQAAGIPTLIPGLAGRLGLQPIYYNPSALSGLVNLPMSPTSTVTPQQLLDYQVAAAYANQYSQAAAAYEQFAISPTSAYGMLPAAYANAYGPAGNAALANAYQAQTAADAGRLQQVHMS